MATLRTVSVIALAGGLAWGGWLVVRSLQPNPKTVPVAARGVPVKQPVLKTSRDGVLDRDPDWLARTLALPKNATLMELDLKQLRARLLADNQVLTASVTRNFPDRLLVQVTERMPIARVRVEVEGELRTLLVARDGVVFAGAGYSPATLDTLPWLAGVVLARKGGVLQPIRGMDEVGALLATAQLKAEHLYRTWETISLAKLESDRELEARTHGAQPVTIVFSADEDYVRQLAWLDDISEQLARRPFVSARIDLSLGGRNVPVTVIEAEPAADARTTAHAKSPALSAKSAVFSSPSLSKREL